MALENNNGQPISIDDQRKRCRVLERLDEAKGATLELEDLDHATLKQCMLGVQWTVAKVGLLQIIDDVLDAKPIKVVPMVAVQDGQEEAARDRA